MKLSMTKSLSSIITVLSDIYAEIAALESRLAKTQALKQGIQNHLEVNKPNRQLYLAVPLETYETFFQSRFAQVAIDRHQLKLIVYNPIAEEIVQWIS